MNRVVWAVALAMAGVLSGASAQQLELSGEQLGCSGVRGELVAFLAPGHGIVLLSSKAFPGASRVGSVRDGRLEADLTRYGRVSLAVDSPSGTEVWGLVDRSLEIGDRRGCFAFGGFRWSTVDDLLTYVHWGVRDVLARIPYEAIGGDTPIVELGERRVTLDLVAPDGKLLRLQGVEGTTLGYRPHETEATFFFQPFVLGPDARQTAVRVSVKRGEFFGPGVTEEIAFVLVGPDKATPLPTDPPISLRLSAVEERVTFVN